MPPACVVQLLARHAALEVSNYFIYTKDPLSDDTYDSGREPGRPGATTAAGGKTTKYYTNQASARLSHQFGPENTAYAQMAGGFTKYDDPGNGNTNGNTNDNVNEDGQWFTPSAGLTYWFSTNNGIETDFSYTRGLYEDNGQSNFNNYDGLAALQPPPHPADRRLRPVPPDLPHVGRPQRHDRQRSGASRTTSSTPRRSASSTSSTRP